MGMSVGGSKAGQIAEPNVVPLIDVLLVLIIAAMVLMPEQPAGFHAQVPQPPSQARPEPIDPRVVVMQVMQDGKLLINREPSDWNSLGEKLYVIFKGRTDKSAFVQGAKDIPFAEIARWTSCAAQASNTSR